MSSKVKRNDAGNEPYITSEPASPIDREIVTKGRELFFNSASVVNDMAKYLIGLVSTLTTLYVSFIAIVNPAYKFVDWPSNEGFLWVALIWLASIAINLLVFYPWQYRMKLNSPSDITENIARINTRKYILLAAGAGLFLFGFLIILALLLSSPGTQNVKFVVTEAGANALLNMSINVDRTTLLTPELILRAENADFFTIEASGNITEIKKILVNGVIHLS